MCLEGIVHRTRDAPNELDIGETEQNGPDGRRRVSEVENVGPDEARTVPRPVGQIPLEGHRELFHVLVHDAGENARRP